MAESPDAIGAALAYVEPEVFDAQGWKASWLNGAVASMRREYYPPRPPLITKDGPGGQLALGGRGALNGEVVLDECEDPAGFDADRQGPVPRGAIALVDSYNIDLDVERRSVPCVDPDNPATAGLVGYRIEERVMVGGLPVAPLADGEIPGLEFHADLGNRLRPGSRDLDELGWESTRRGHCVDPGNHEGLRTQRETENVPCREKWGDAYPEGTLTRTTETVIWPASLQENVSAIAWEDDGCYRNDSSRVVRPRNCGGGRWVSNGSVITTTYYREYAAQNPRRVNTRQTTRTTGSCYHDSPDNFDGDSDHGDIDPNDRDSGVTSSNPGSSWSR